MSRSLFRRCHGQNTEEKACQLSPRLMLEPTQRAEAWAFWCRNFDGASSSTAAAEKPEWDRSLVGVAGTEDNLCLSPFAWVKDLSRWEESSTSALHPQYFRASTAVGAWPAQAETYPETFFDPLIPCVGHTSTFIENETCVFLERPRYSNASGKPLYVVVLLPPLSRGSGLAPPYHSDLTRAAGTKAPNNSDRHKAQGPLAAKDVRHPL